MKRAESEPSLGSIPRSLKRRSEMKKAEPVPPSLRRASGAKKSETQGKAPDPLLVANHCEEENENVESCHQKMLQVIFSCR